MTKEQAIKLAETKFWETMTYRERAVFQFNEKMLCMPFDVFHEAIEKTLGRPVYTHEFGLNYDGLAKELNGDGPAPTLEEIFNMIPAEKKTCGNGVNNIKIRRTEMIEEMKEMLNEILADDEFFVLNARVYKKAFEALRAQGFDREEAVTLIGGMFKGK